MNLMSQDYWWPQLWKYVKEFIGSCDVCVRAKKIHYCPHGLLEPLLIPTSLWYSISMDFITNLPPSNSYDSILVMVYYLMKMAYFISCTKTIINERIAKSFLDHVFWYHNVLEDIVSDHGRQFASMFWKQLFVQTFRCENEVVINFPPQIDGQIEWVNQVLEQYLQCITKRIGQNFWPWQSLHTTMQCTH
jgi:hypothetical protein